MEIYQIFENKELVTDYGPILQNYNKYKYQ